MDMDYVELMDLYNSKIELLLGKIHYKRNEDFGKTLIIFEELLSVQQKKIALFHEQFEALK